MGLNIGQIPASLSARPDRAAGARQARRDGEDAPKQEPTRVGFGENTLSPGAAALRTIDVGLREARRVVPTVEELREDFRARRAENEDAAAAREADEVREPTPREAAPAEQSTRPEPAPQVRAFEAQRNAAPTPNPGPAPARLDVSV